MVQFTNQAQLTFNGQVTTSNIAVGELVEVLSATKTAIVNEYSLNDNLTYVISIINSGTTAYTGVTVTDNLGAYPGPTATTLYPLTYIDGSVSYYVNGVLQAAPTVTAGPPLEFSGINVPANGNVIIVYEATANQFAPLDVADTIVNEATISGAGITTPIVVTETVETEDTPILSITKTVSPVPVTENGTLTYTFIIQNSGNTAVVAADDVIITDTFNPILENLTATFNGTTWAEGVNYTFDTVTGLFQSLPGQIEVPAATYTQDPTTGAWIINPGSSTLIISGTV